MVGIDEEVTIHRSDDRTGILIIDKYLGPELIIPIDSCSGMHNRHPAIEVLYTHFILMQQISDCKDLRWLTRRPEGDVEHQKEERCKDKRHCNKDEHPLYLRDGII
jgi:hypothetical protein